MNKLLKANFSRLKSETSLWLVAGATLGIAIAFVLDRGMISRNPNYDGAEITLNSVMFEFLPFIGLLFAVFTAPYIGKEYSDKTMRNKLIVGHKRENIYISNYIICFVGSLFIYAMLLVGGFAVGIPYLGSWQGDISTLITYILMGVFFTASLASVLTMLCMLCSKRSVSAVACVILALGLMILASSIYNALSEPEMTRELISYTVDGVELGDPVPNPMYVGGFKRTVCEFLVQFLPTGQGILIANEEVTHPVLNIIYSMATTVIVNFCGIAAFKKKDIK